MRIHSYVENSLLLAIGNAYDSIWREFNARLQKQDCNLLQALVLVALFFEKSESVTPSRLSLILKASRAGISHALSDLEKRGWVQRQLALRDARSYQLRLKPEGKKAAIRLIQMIDELETFFERGFGKEPVQAAVQSLRQMSESYRQRSRVIRTGSIPQAGASGRRNAQSADSNPRHG